MTERPAQSHEPADLNEYIITPQTQPFMTALQENLAVCQKENKPVPPILITGPAGCGKTSLGKAILKTIRYNIVESLGANITSPENVFDNVRELFANKSILSGWLIDEIHGMRRTPVVNLMYKIMTGEPFDVTTSTRGKQKKTSRIYVPPVTIIGCTTDTGKLPMALRSRFPIKVPVFPLDVESVVQIIKQFFRKERVEIEDDAAYSIAARTFGIARTAINLGKQIITSLKYNGATIAKYDIVENTLLNKYKITPEGFTYEHYQYLKFLGTVPSAGIENVATIINVDKQYLVDQIEPPLITGLLMTRGQGGRRITDTGVRTAHYLAEFYGETLNLKASETSESSFVEMFGSFENA